MCSFDDETNPKSERVPLNFKKLEFLSRPWVCVYSGYTVIRRGIPIGTLCLVRYFGDDAKRGRLKERADVGECTQCARRGGGW